MMTKSPWEQWKQSLGETRPWDLLNPKTEYVKKEIAQARYDICKECPFLLPTKQCSKCGCFMKAKVKIAHAECPEHKWNKAIQETDLA
jgi:hypothetical protein